MENKEHNLQDKRCECCGYMTYQSEHMGCIRAAEQAQQAVPNEMEVPDCTGYDLGNNFEIGYATGWNECREAMLAAAPQGASCLPAEMTPAMMRAVQMRSELGAYAAANLSGAYDLFAEFWRVAVEEAQKGGA